jgi:hypothetical protein
MKFSRQEAQGGGALNGARTDPYGPQRGSGSFVPQKFSPGLKSAPVEGTGVAMVFKSRKKAKPGGCWIMS